MSERDQSSWNEQELDALLSDFFQQEMPEEIKNPSVPFGVSPPAAPLPKRRRQTGLISIFAVTAALVLIVIVIQKQFEDSGQSIPERSTHPFSLLVENGEDSNSGSLRIRPDFPNGLQPSVPLSNFWVHTSENSFEYTEMVSQAIEPIKTPDGPVEMRNTLYTSKKTMIDPDTGTAIKITFTEFEIEIYPEVFDEE